MARKKLASALLKIAGVSKPEPAKRAKKTKAKSPAKKKTASKKTAKPKPKAAPKKKVPKPKPKTVKAKKPAVKKAKPAAKKAKAAKPKARAKKVSRKTKHPVFDNKELYTFLLDLVGDEGMDVVKRVTDEEVSDVDLAEDMELKANIIRKHLYRLYEAGVVTYRRHRSKTGWYTYYWKLHPNRINMAIGELKQSQAKELQEILDYERDNHFYECTNGCIRAIFDEAIEHQFRCPRCEEKLEFMDNAKRVSELERQVAKLSK
jgi:transcription initiation factor TFIIE subunit alpha